jgi:peptide/nickel transport system ATP-binding protein
MSALAAEEADPATPTGELVVEDLHVRYGEVEAVRGVSLRAPAGRTLALVGESGCGKSSLALALARLLPPGTEVSGRVTVGAYEFSAATGAELRDARGRVVAYMPQDAMAALNPVHSAGRQIGEVLRHRRGASRGQALDGAVELLREVGINDPGAAARRYPHELSGGMRQRVMLAIALAARPSVLIADEPTTALDVTVQAAILSLVRALVREERMTLVWITHDIGVVAEIADEVAVMYGGQIVEHGSAARIFEAPAHPYTIALVGSQRDSRLAAAKTPFRAIPGSPPLGKPPDGCPFAPRCAYAAEVCAETVPDKLPLADGHLAACHFADALDERIGIPQ